MEYNANLNNNTNDLSDTDNSNVNSQLIPDSTGHQKSNKNYQNANGVSKNSKVFKSFGDNTMKTKANVMLNNLDDGTAHA